MAELTKDFYLDLSKQTIVTGTASSVTPGNICFYQDDTYLLVLHGLTPDSNAPSPDIYDEVPLVYAKIAAGLFAVGPDAAPSAGSIMFVGDNGDTTDALTYPFTKSALQIALNALPSVTTAGGLTVLATGPGNFFTIQWNSEPPSWGFTAVENKLLPLCLALIRTNNQVDGQLLIKLIQAPLAYTDSFTNPDPPAVTEQTVRTGNANRNAIQAITVPAGAMGQYAFGWSGSETQVVNVGSATMTTDIATVLNALYASGTQFLVTNPSTGLYYVELTGSLGNAAQPDLTIVMYGQIVSGNPQASLPITNQVPTDELLLGQPNIPVLFEIAAWDENNDKTVLAQMMVTFINDAIETTLSSDLAAAGAVLVLTQTVVVNNSTLEPIATVAAGAGFTPPESGDSMAVDHELNTWYPTVVVHLQTGTDPETWLEIPGDEYEAVATDVNHVTISGLPMSSDPTSPYYFENWKIFIYSPDATVKLLQITLPTDDIYRVVGDANVPLNTILDALAAALPSGWPNIPANKLTGLLAPGQIDLTALSTALTANAAFITALTTDVTNATIIQAIAQSLATSVDFLNTLNTLIQNSTILSTLITALKADSDFTQFFANSLTTALATTSVQQTLAALVTSIIQNGGVLPTGMVLMTLADVTVSYPELRGTRTCAPLPGALDNTTNLGDFTGTLPKASSANSGKRYTVVVTASSQPVNGRRALEFEDGMIVASDGNIWFAGAIEGNTLYPVEMERELFTLIVNSDMLSAGTQFACNFTFAIAMTGNCAGSCDLVIETGALDSDSGDGIGANLSEVDFNETPVIQRITLSNATVYHTFGYKVIRGADAVGFAGTAAWVSLDFTSWDHTTVTFVLGSGVLTYEWAGDGFVALLSGTSGWNRDDVNAIHKTWTNPAIGAITFDGSITDVHGIVVTKSAGDDPISTPTLSAATTIYAASAATAAVPATPNFAVRARLVRFDTENVPAPEGLVTLSMKGAKASIVISS